MYEITKLIFFSGVKKKQKRQQKRQQKSQQKRPQKIENLGMMISPWSWGQTVKGKGNAHKSDIRMFMSQEKTFLRIFKRVFKSCFNKFDFYEILDLH